MFELSTFLSLAWAALTTIGFVQGSYQSHPVEGILLNGAVWEASLAMLGVQTTALVGLYMRRHWGRAVATAASGFWIFTLFGIPFAILAWWVLHRRWEPGVESTFDKDHPVAPAYIVGLCAVGTVLLLAWLWFLYGYLVPLLTQLNPSFDVSSWYWIASIAFFFSIPLWVVQGLALLGLIQRHDWGAVLAMITSVLWAMSVIGLPFGIAGLMVLWRVAAPGP